MEQQRSSDTNAVKVPALPEDDLAHFEALVDRMLRDRAETAFPSRSKPEALVEAPRITVSHPAEFLGDRRPEEPASVVAPPWHVRHARKLIGTGVLVVGAGTAYLAYTNGWRFPAEQVRTAAPAAPEPTAVQRPITPTPPPPTALAEAPASASVRPAAPPPQPTAAAARKPAATPRPAAPAPVPTAASARPPAVTHTLREAAPVPVSAAAAPAVVAAPQPAAAASDCPENVAALGLCAARISKGAK